MSVDLSFLDNDTTKIYKHVEILNVPARFIFLDDDEYIYIMTYITKLIKDGKSLRDIVKSLPLYEL